MISSSSNSIPATAGSYTDLASLNSIRQLGRADKNLALAEIAKQFESMMVQMMMKSMRSANDVFAEGNFLNSHEGDMYQDMFDDQLGLSLSQDGGLGIADVMVRQLQGRFGISETEKVTKDLNDYREHRNTVINPTVGIKVAETKVERVEAAANKKQSPVIEFDGSSNGFVSQLYSMAKSAAEKLGITPAVLIAQAALETGWGKKITSIGDKSSLNLFNIKADQRWQGASIAVPTIEFRDGLPVRERAAFRAYDSLEKSFDDYADFIQNNARYQKALNTNDAESYIHALKEAGYATDPNYAEKIISIMRSDEMKQSIELSEAVAMTGQVM